MTRRWILFVLAGVIYAAPFAALAWVISRPDTLSVVSPPVEEVWISPSLIESDQAQAAIVEYEVSGGVRLIAPEWRGVVTAVDIGPGAVIEHLDRVVTVDNIGRLAVFSDVPFYRILKSGDKGQDVDALHELLTSLRFIDESPGSSFTKATGLAVRSYRESLGDLAPTEVFEPGLVVYLPTESLALGSIELAVGAPATGPGEVIASEKVTITDAALSSVDGTDLTLKSSLVWLFTIDNQSFAVDPDTSTLVDPALLPVADPKASGASAGSVHTT